MSKFDELKKLAEAATPGPWMRLFGERTVYDRMEDGCRGNAIVRADGAESKNVDFIAAANPAAILELLAIQAQLVAALQVTQFIVDNDGGNDHEKSMVRATLAAAGAQS